MSEILDRIKNARESKGLSQTDVATKLGLGLRQYQNIEAGEFPKYKTEHVRNMEKILGIDIYEEIYAIKVQKETLGEEQPSYKKDSHLIPVFEQGPGTDPDFWWKGIPRLNDCDHAIRAKGVSMAALIREGSIVIGKELYHKEKIVMGEIYIIKTKEQEYIRYVNQHPEKEDFFILSPYNQKAGETVLHKNDIINLYEYRASFQFA